MINLDKLIADFKQALEWRCPYLLPGNTTMGTIPNGVDCSGLLVAAFKDQGAYIFHGSNTIARSSVNGLDKLTKVSQLKIGSVVFKWQNNGGEPEKYKKDGMGNFHHIGLVVSVSPLKIIHASSAAGEVTQDTSIKRWQYTALLKDVDYGTTTDYDEPEREMSVGMYDVQIIASSLRIRREPTTDSEVLGSIPRGTIVPCKALVDGWYKLNDCDGYISAEYVNVVAQSEEQPTEPIDEDHQDVEYVTRAEFNALKERVERLENNG